MPAVNTNFKPQQHGFNFINHFEFPSSIRFNIPVITRAPITAGDLVYGLCGGMCFTALDLFHAQRPAPDVNDEEAVPLRLFYFLWKRQLDSLGRDVVRKLFQWMIMSDSSVARAMNEREIPRLRQSIDQGNPVVLSLVRVKGLSDPTQNHQVVAIGYDLNPTTKDMTIYLYDPNWPRKDTQITLNLAKPSQGLKIKQSTGETLRGFFIIPYTPEIPPARI